MHYTSIITNGGQHKLGLPKGSWDEVCGDPWILARSQPQIVTWEPAFVRTTHAR